MQKGCISKRNCIQNDQNLQFNNVSAHRKTGGVGPSRTIPGPTRTQVRVRLVFLSQGSESDSVGLGPWSESQPPAAAHRCPLWVRVGPIQISKRSESDPGPSRTVRAAHYVGDGPSPSWSESDSEGSSKRFGPTRTAPPWGGGPLCGHVGRGGPSSAEKQVAHPPSNGTTM